MLSRETLYKFNRVVLLSLFVISLVVPFIHVSFAKDVPYSGLALNIDQLIAMAVSEDSVAVTKNSNIDVWVQGLFILYLAGSLFFFCRMAVSLIRIMMMIRSSDVRRLRVDGVRLIIHKKELTPFSWMKYIVISEKDYQESSKEIITHELAHIEGKHSIDLILAEAVNILHWFNPAAYLLKQELRNIHEYQADEAVIDKGIDAKQYQLLLIKKAVGDRLYTMANSFNHSKLKNRITMISKEKSNRMAAIKALFVLPLSALAVVAFASEKATSSMEVISNVKVTEIFISDTLKSDDKNLSSALSSRVKDTVKLRIAGHDTVHTSIIVSDIYNDVKPLIIVDGKEFDIKLMNSINPNAIESINVLKGKAASDIYGERGKNGVIVISLKSVDVDRSDKKADYNYGPAVKIRINGNNDDVLYIVNGKEMDPKEAILIVPELIESMTILKGDVAKAKYGDKVKYGAIEITLKPEGTIK